MIVIHDAQNYQDEGQMIATDGMIKYLQTGPHREPIYSLLVTFAMSVASVIGGTYQTIIVFIQGCLLLLSQLLIYKILNKLNIHKAVQAGILFYWAISPAVANSAFGLWSEVIVFPLFLILVLILLETILFFERQDVLSNKAIFYSIVIGFLLSLLAFTKAIFELGGILSLIIIISMLAIATKGSLKKISSLCLALGIAMGVFLGCTNAYKLANKVFNGNFEITYGRGHVMFYGNTAALTTRNSKDDLFRAVLDIPDVGLCEKNYSQAQCEQWNSGPIDYIGNIKAKELINKGYSSNSTVKKEIHKEALKLIIDNPGWYVLYYMVSVIKMFCWEGTNIGFVIYPKWLDGIYNLPNLNVILSLTVDLMSLVAFIYTVYFLIGRKDSVDLKRILVCVMGLIIPFIILYSSVFVLKRYALPLAPLYLILIAFFFDQLMKKFKRPIR